MDRAGEFDERGVAAGPWCYPKPFEPRRELLGADWSSGRAAREEPLVLVGVPDRDMALAVGDKLPKQISDGLRKLKGSFPSVSSTLPDVSLT